MLAVVGLLIASAMLTLSAQIDQRNINETRRRLEEARELLLAFAVQNGRLPCPASATSNGDESPSAGGACTNYLNGFLPAVAIGFLPVDGSGYAVDAWGNRLRYVVAQNAANPTGSTSCSSPSNPDAFTNPTKLRTNGVKCAPRDLVICDASQNTVAGSPPSCGTWGAPGDARAVTNQLTVVAVIYSTGKNTTTSGGNGADEAENLDGDGVFVHHEPRPSTAPGGEYDDQLVWIPAGLLYSRLISASILP